MKIVTGAIGLTLALILAAPHSVIAAEYPDRPIRVLVGYPPGGPTDVIARLVTDQMAETLGRPVIVDNRPGAGSNIATQAVATAAPDGYTLLMGAFANAVNPAMMQVPYDTKRDLVPISMVARVPLVVVASPNAPFSTIGELLAFAKAKPGALNHAAGGIGSSSHLAGELFKRRGGVNIVTVPYKGGAAALQDLLAGRVELYFDHPNSSLPHVESGRAKLLAVTAQQRLPWLPNVPTVAESGIPGFEVITWVGLFGRAGTPAPIVDQLYKAAAAAVASPKVKERFSKFGTEPVGNQPAEFAAFLYSEMETWGRIIREGNIRAE